MEIQSLLTEKKEHLSAPTLQKYQLDICNEVAVCLIA